MANWGDGSRAIVMVVWKNSNKGHVFNIERVSGQTVAVDPQTGHRVHLDNYLKMSKPTITEISRVDNLPTPNESYMKMAVKKKGT